MSEFGVCEISNSDLKEVDIPSEDASWQAIAQFALTFDGYQYWGSFERCAEIANTRENDGLTNLRTCLFFEQRRWRHFDAEPDAETMSYIRGLISGIRDRIQRGEIE